MTNLPHANSRPVSVRNIVPSTPHFTLRMTSGILEPGLHTATITGVLLEREGGGKEERDGMEGFNSSVLAGMFFGRFDHTIIWVE